MTKISVASHTDNDVTRANEPKQQCCNLMNDRYRCTLYRIQKNLAYRFETTTMRFMGWH